MECIAEWESCEESNFGSFLFLYYFQNGCYFFEIFLDPSRPAERLVIEGAGWAWFSHKFPNIASRRNSSMEAEPHFILRGHQV